MGLAAPIDPVRSEFWLAKGFASLDSDRPEEAQAALRHSLALSPMNARAWYGYALAAERFDWLNRTSSRALKMSYYTGFNQSDLVEGRLLLLARADTRADPELELLLRRQVRSIILRAPALEPLLERTYFAATEVNREIIASEMRQAGRTPPGQQR
ncbi:hypothetical protein EAS54_16305 [Bradyrhizobium guangzhouense]|nr:hypothetical protein EAS54_16305 [Bradyrhizobium guangzhouense]